MSWLKLALGLIREAAGTGVGQEMINNMRSSRRIALRAFRVAFVGGRVFLGVYVHPTPERLEDAFAKLEVYNLAKVEELKAKEKPRSATVQ